MKLVMKDMLNPKAKLNSIAKGGANEYNKYVNGVISLGMEIRFFCRTRRPSALRGI